MRPKRFCNPVVAFAELLYARQAGKATLRRRAQRELARQGMKVSFAGEDDGEGAGGCCTPRGEDGPPDCPVREPRL